MRSRASARRASASAFASSALHVLELALELDDPRDTGEVDALFLRQLLDEPQPLDVGLRVQPRVARRALRRHERLRS